jgi:excisionase family DNA binding protein
MNTLPDLPDKKLLRVSEAAAYFGVDESTIRRWIDHGKLEAEKPVGTVFISRESIKNFRLSGHDH